MKMAFTAALFFIVSGIATAQADIPIEQKAQYVADQLKTGGSYLSSEQRQRISMQLDLIQRLIYGQDDRMESSFTCVARDNDGRNPYVFASRTGIQVTHISGETFSDIASCQSSLASARFVGGRRFICVSRDNDSRNPFQLSILSDTAITRISRAIVNSLDECQTMLRNMRVQNGLGLLCVPRDNDGRSPYVAMSIDPRTGGIQTGTEVFSDIGSCNAFINN